MIEDERNWTAKTLKRRSLRLGKLLAPRLALVIVVGGSVGGGSVAGIEPRARPFDAPLEWRRLPDLPERLGVAGPFVGVVRDESHEGREALVVAGGASFPEPIWETSKQWFADIHVLIAHASESDQEEPNFRWLTLPPLSEPIAYGVSVETPLGLLCIGGSDGVAVRRECFALRWDGAAGKVRVTSAPPLPAPRVHATGAWIDDAVWLVGGQSGLGLDSATTSIWRLSRSAWEEGGSWEPRGAFPGAERAFAVSVVQSDGRGERWFVFSGRRSSAESPSGVELLVDGWSFDPRVPSGESWVRLADAPRCVMAGTAAAIGPAHVFVLSGDNGEFFGRADELRDEHPGFQRRALAYHTITDTWVDAGDIPANHVTTSAVRFAGGIVIPSGEIRPRRRTPEVLLAVPKPRSIQLGAWDLSVVGVYLAVLIAIGAYFSRKERSTEDFFLGGRRIPWWAAGLSIFGTQLSAITFMAIPAHVYRTDWLYLVGNLMIVAVAPLVVVAYLPFFRGLGLTSAYEYLELRFDALIRLLGSAAYVLFQLGRMGVVLYLPALALATVTGLDVHVSIVVMGVLATTYTVAGGIEAVIWTDVLQVGVLLGGAIVSLVLILVSSQTGSIETLADAYEAGKFRMADWSWNATTTTIWVVAVGKLLENLIPYTSDQAVVQRYLATPDVRRAARAVWTNAILAVPASVLFFALGTALWVFYREKPELLDPVGRAGDVFPWFIVQNLPVGVAGLVIAGLFAASMSSLDSSINSIATAVTTDFWRRLRPNGDERSALRFARWLTILLGALGTGFALLLAALGSASMWDTYSRVVGLFGSGLAGLFLAGIFTRTTCARGALIGFVSSAVALTVAQSVGSGVLHFFLWPAIGIITCIVVGWIASALLASWGLGGARQTSGLTVYTRTRNPEERA